MEAEHKKLGSDYDRQQEKIKEARMELKGKTKELKELAKTMAKILEEVSKERMELMSQHYQELEWAKTVLVRVQTT